MRSEHSLPGPHALNAPQPDFVIIADIGARRSCRSATVEAQGE
jgi:hypothetical protein